MKSKLFLAAAVAVAVTAVAAYAKPDANQAANFGGLEPGNPADLDAPPDIFTAFEQQLGLKLQPTKAVVDVMVIDRIERPSPN